MREIDRGGRGAGEVKMDCYCERKDERDERKDGETGSFECVDDGGGGVCVCVAKGEGVINDVSPHTHSLLYRYWKISYGYFWWMDHHAMCLRQQSG